MVRKYVPIRNYYLHDKEPVVLSKIAEKVEEAGGTHKVKLTRNEWMLVGRTCEPHVCQGSLMRCCGEFRCELCHLRHMHAVHSEIATQSFERYHESTRIIKDEQRTDPPQKKPAEKRVVSNPLFDKLMAAIMKATPEELERSAITVGKLMKRRGKL